MNEPNEKTLEQPLIASEPESRVTAGEEKEVSQPEENKRKNFIYLLQQKLEALIGSKEKAKKMTTVLLVTGVLFAVLFIVSLFGKPADRRSAPEPTPVPTPVIDRSVTPAQLNKDDIGKLSDELENFDTEKRDLVPPGLDFEISL